MGTATMANRNLGSGSAEQDPRFRHHFVSTADFDRLVSDSCAVVIGAKGSGKTALMMSLTTVYKERFAGVHAIKLDELKFGPLVEAIKRLDKASHHGILSIARTSWQNVIGIYILEGVRQTELVDGDTRSDIVKYLRKTDQLNTAATEKMGGHLERIWAVICSWSGEAERGRAEPLQSLSAKQHAVISAFPSDDNMERLLRKAMDEARAREKPFLLCFDGLDSVVEHSLEARDIIFAGLIDAAYKCVTHPIFSGGLALKVLLPKELAHGARRYIRDLDKEEQFVEAIHWDSDNLAEFMRKRLEEYTKTKNRPFDEVWKEYFPERVRNDAHGVEEDTFQYFLRHTLYRPRQLLIQVQQVLNKWDSRDPNASFRVDPTFIPRAISEVNTRLSEYIVNELRLDFPALEHFLRSFRGLPSVLEWWQVEDRMSRFLEISPKDVEQAFTDLYNYGVFGIAKDVEADSRKMVPFTFGFMTPDVESNVVRRLTAKSLIGLSPMFVEYCGCKPSTVGVVVPTA
jgi:hypothetical protein